MKHTKRPSDWKNNIAEICQDMGITNIDEEAINLLCLVIQQETCELLKSCSSLAKSSSSSEITAANARVACHSYNMISFIHPRYYQTKFENLAQAVNSQPLLREVFEDYQLCTNLNLSSSAWKISEDKCV